ALAAPEGQSVRNVRLSRRHDQSSARRRRRSRAVPAGGEGRARHRPDQGDGAGARPDRHDESGKALRVSERPLLGSLPAQFDLVVIGGGITGAGIAREAVRTGASVLLVEQNDFASGTSSRSSKLVHGGLRYLKSGQWRLTLESVRERQRLMREAPGLISPQIFLMPLYRGSKPGRWLLRIGL